MKYPPLAGKDTQSVQGKERRGRRREEEEERRYKKRKEKQRSEGKGEKAKDKRWMEAARTGATERSSPTKKKNSSSIKGEKRWRRKAETCPQVTHTHTQRHTCMCIHNRQTTGCTCGFLYAHA